MVWFQSSLHTLLILPGLVASKGVRTRKLQALSNAEIPPVDDPPVDESFASLLSGFKKVNLLEGVSGGKVTSFDGTDFGDQSSIFVTAPLNANIRTSSFLLEITQDGNVEWQQSALLSGTETVSGFAYLAAGETFTYTATFTAQDAEGNELDNPATFTLTVNGVNNPPFVTAGTVTEYDIKGGQRTRLEPAFDGVEDIDTPVDQLQVFSIDQIGGRDLCTLDDDNVVWFKDVGNNLRQGEFLNCRLNITDGLGGFVEKFIGVAGI